VDGLRKLLVTPVALTIGIAMAGTVVAADAVLILQRSRAFSETTVQIRRGDVLRFNNDDRFNHQIYVNAPSMNFESDEQVPGTSVTVSFPAAGSFEVRCHIHPKMLLTVDVR
jgi:plastocyanin